MILINSNDVEQLLALKVLRKVIQTKWRGKEVKKQEG
jgi:hypothetical protein